MKAAYLKAKNQFEIREVEVREPEFPYAPERREY